MYIFNLDGMSPREDNTAVAEESIASPPPTPSETETSRKRTISSSQPSQLPEVWQNIIFLLFPHSFLECFSKMVFLSYTSLRGKKHVNNTLCVTGWGLSKLKMYL